ncbi:MAG: hypothetical protein JW888_11380 [Pirellulales bacterium]|nr:hypothetical protein [Pirellulales bacterium]
MTPQATITEEFIERDEQRNDCADYTVTGKHSVRSRIPPCDWLPEITKQLEAIEALPDGWDSHGAPSPDSRKLKAARGLLCSLCEVPDLPQPYVNPTRNGGVQFEWEVGQRYFELEVVGERAATYLYRDDVAHREETGDVFELESLECVLRYICSVGATQ